LVVRSVLFLLEDAVQEVLELVLSWLLAFSLVFHRGQNDVHGAHFLELARANNRRSDLLVLHRWDDLADLTLESAMTVCDGADGGGSSTRVAVLDRHT